MWVEYTEFVAPSPDLPAGYDTCSFASDYLGCTRMKGHTGRHQASGFKHMFAVWQDETGE